MPRNRSANFKEQNVLHRMTKKIETKVENIAEKPTTQYSNYDQVQVVFPNTIRMTHLNEDLLYEPTDKMSIRASTSNTLVNILY